MRDRVNGLLATNAIVLQSAIASLLSKDAAKDFKKLVETMSDG